MSCSVKCLIILAAVYAMPMTGQAQSVALNEILASNNENIADEDGDYEDWIELYNHGEEAVNLLSFGLSDDVASPYRWRFPNVIIQPGEFMIVWASGKDRRNPAGELHANFSIDRDGEEILFTHPDGTRLDELAPTAIPTDISIGRQPDGTGDWHFFTNPTPGASNDTEGYRDILEPPLFSVDGGFHTNGFDLDITSIDNNVTIHYTLDGSPPGPDSPVYQGPLQVENRTHEPNVISQIRTYFNEDVWLPPEGNVAKSTVVRARAVRPGALSSEIVTHSYFVKPEGASRYTLPVISIATDSHHLFDHNDGIYVPGIDFTGNPWSGNHARRGRQWELPIHFEFFEPEGKLGFSLNAGARIHGGFSRAVPIKTLRIYARRDYDTQNWIEYPIFPGYDVTRFKRLLLRNSGNDWGGHPWATPNNSQPGTYFRDALMQGLVDHLDFETQAYQPAVIFINGEYWGIHNIRERYDQHYLYARYGLEEDEIDLLTDISIVKTGSNTHYEEMLAFMAGNDLNDPDHFDYITTQMDVDGFLDYYLANIYFDNTDWPHKNLDYWRYRTDSYDPDAPPGRDGRWRWLMYDTDFGFSLDGDHNPGAGPGRNTLQHALNRRENDQNLARSTLLMRSILENDDFRNRFINRYADLLNSAFDPDRVLEEIAARQAVLAPEIEEHLRRWRYPEDRQRWEANIDVMRTFAVERPANARDHVRQHFGIPGTVDLTVDVSTSGGGVVEVNSIRIDGTTPGISYHPYPWQGIYFQNNPITLSAHPATGYRFVHWYGLGEESSSAAITVQPSSSVPIQATAVFEPDPHADLNPPAFDLRNGSYTFTEWSHESPAGTYPPNMIFQQTTVQDPGIEDEFESFWELPYDLDSRSRVAGLGASGIGFINTSNPQEIEGAGYLGGAIVSINTVGQRSVFVHWTGGTVLPNSRVYNLRLQYRVGDEDSFIDVTDDGGEIVEYRRNPSGGHSQVIGPTALPENALDRPYVQLRWKYYYTGERIDEESGQRALLRLDDIHIEGSSEVSTEEIVELPHEVTLHQNYPNPFNPDTRVAFELPEAAHVRLTVFDALGREVERLVDEQRAAGVYSLRWSAADLPSGVFFLRMEADEQVHMRKMVLVR